MSTPDQASRGVHLRWYREVGLVAAFYIVYSIVRNRFGSASVSAGEAFANARTIIDIEKNMGLFFEPRLQELLIDQTWFIQFWNIFYGTFHFAATAGVMLWLYRRHPNHYPSCRDSLGFTTALALVGFAVFPLMPPRLLGETGPFGGRSPDYRFVDTISDIGGLWSFDSGTMQSVSNQYAAMPSLHFGWALWCAVAIWPVLRRRWSRAAYGLYPWATLFAIVITANHFWLDAVGGAVVLGLGTVLGNQFAQMMAERSERQRVADEAPAAAKTSARV